MEEKDIIFDFRVSRIHFDVPIVSLGRVLNFLILRRIFGLDRNLPWFLEYESTMYVVDVYILV